MKALKFVLLSLALAVLLPITTKAATVSLPKDLARSLQEFLTSSEEDYSIEILTTETTEVLLQATRDPVTSNYQNKTVNRTLNVNNQAGQVVWSLTLTAKFLYNGSSAECIGCSHGANACQAGWSIKSSSSTKSGNNATATATAVHKLFFLSSEQTQSLSITCLADGTIQ